ncbi:LON peptidase N-terminal domain and RING finger protein 3 [Gracilariopsis chorda]|uniref:LON peptidase N-terminal domain and RING finger protein 3 n=1 Tax=Gracilariopsis chorda TaxID=448386 RepID=A0A2V3IHX0_9FLOR|nr:LON peptidase N-terminal domain and RING finger protein 3 [Gracilariopsis chorda]|eukprot:PXF41623.1 LON peptidase N-terminal domain and RING finger protein 3 [Gracilariopsis chorda]
MSNRNESRPCFTSPLPPALPARRSFPLPRNAAITHRAPPARKRLRARVAPRMGDSVDGGTMPSFPDDEPQAVQFFNASKQPDSVDESALVELPLFPLQLVLMPAMNLPLHIFELRYRLLFNRLRDGDARFGIVLYDANTSSLAQVGCSAELTRFEPLPDGRIMTDNVGRRRFEIVKIIDEKPYTRALVRFFDDKAPGGDLSSLVKEVSLALQDVLRLSNKLYDKVLDLSPDIKRLAPNGQIPQTDDSGWPSPSMVQEFSFSVCQVLDMPLKEQQILLQIDDTAARLRRQEKMLDTARKYLAAQVTIKEAGLGQL